jgi:rare lipoprotein A
MGYFIGFILSILPFLSGCSEKKQSYTLSKARCEATMRPYTIKGRTYRPTYVEVGDTMRGVSSWYGPNFHGKHTSSGEVYNMYDKTAAHKTWPMNTMVLVENLDNGKSVVVRINDRGPFVSGRVIDCSYRAGKKIGLDKSGIARVKLTVLGFAGKIYRPKLKSTPPPKIKLTNFGVQVGAFKNRGGAKEYKKKFASKIKSKNRIVIKRFEEESGVLFRVWILGFGSEDEAKAFIDENSIDGGVVISV